MSKKTQIYWSVWIGVWTGIYVILYLISPLSQYGIIWCTFIALPIFFNGGAARADYFPQMVSSCVGVGWGWLMLYVAGIFGVGMDGNVAMALSCGLLTITCCMMMMIPQKALINKVPAMFGGISSCFGTYDAEVPEKLIVLMVTLCLGVSLGLLCNEGLPFCKKLAGDNS